MAQLTIIQAINDALRTALQADPRVILMGEDIGKNGGVFRATEGLQEEFGGDRVVDTPLAEAGIIGTAHGMAVNGMIPIPEIQFLGFIYPAVEQIVTHVAKVRYRTMGRFTCPMVIRAPFGGGIRAPELHADTPEVFFAHVPGIKVVAPSNPYDAKGMLLAAIDDPDPVLFLEPMRIYRAFRDEVPKGRYTVELGKAKVVKEGTDLTLISWGTMLHEALRAVKKAEEQFGWKVEVIDLRSISPIDRDTIVASVEKTGRAIVVQEAPKSHGVSAEIVSLINDHCLFSLEAPVGRVAGFDAHYPFFALEDHYNPHPDRIVSGMERVMTY